MKGYLYILKSLQNNRYYVGSCLNLTNRLDQHNKGYNKSTKLGRPWNIVFSKEFDDIKIARQIEYKLKKLKSRIITEKIVASQKIILGP